MHKILKLTLATSFFALSATQFSNAADFGGTALRGSIQPQQQSSAQLWDGVYVGALGGYGAANVSSTTTAQNLAANYYYGTDFQNNKSGPPASTFIQVPKSTTQTPTMGLVIGYNSTWEDAVLGIEADYQRYNLNTKSVFDTGGHQFDTGRTVDINTVDALGVAVTKTFPINGHFSITGSDVTKITDVVTLRGRAGYAMGNFLPFITAGVAIGHGSRTTSITTSDYYFTQLTQSATNTNTTKSTNRDRFVGGIAIGAGADYAITPNLFLRAEYQYIKFSSFGGANVAMSNARAGVAAKF